MKSLGKPWGFSGFWLLASGFWILDSGFWILDSGFFGIGIGDVAICHTGPQNWVVLRLLAFIPTYARCDY
jgi:hypothetical protein